MSSSRLLSPELRSGLMVALGTLLVVGPVVIGLSTAAASFGLVVGVLTVALGLAGSENTGRGTLPVSSQAVFDAGLALGLLLAAVVFAIAGSVGEAGFFAAAGLGAGLLTARTRYTLRPSQNFL
jgi:hypothetical protein